ncbi:LOW QUALITY PROTEIN: cilia- and flagella-associated protein 251 [Bombus vancouverensis nearcticus]|uniref:LOW QUALITY PROTEIN: cilia- and flagella-associated protein 251 n=1 Tax=Bombus vancouverensis nearcticus TaxID=2705178 RepID=UPI00402BF180
MAANVSIPSCSKESTDSKSERETNIRAPYEKEETDFNLCPFELLWSFGTNSDTPIINLTTKNRTIIAYACSHAVIIYNYKTKYAISLQGHKNTVKTLSTSKDGKWLMSADFEKDCVTVVWDTETGVPISTLFNPHGDKGMTAAKISPNAKYIVTVGNEFHQKVQFWLWTYGKDQPDAFTELTELFSNRIKEIAFNEDCSEEFGLTADYCVAFLKWIGGDLSKKVAAESTLKFRVKLSFRLHRILLTSRGSTPQTNRGPELDCSREKRCQSWLCHCIICDIFPFRGQIESKQRDINEGTGNYSLDREEQDELKYYIPKILGNVRRYGILNCSCYIPKTQRVLTATTNGYVLVWGTFVERQKNKSKDQSAANNKEKRHIKSVQLEKNSIMVILYHDGRIVTGTSEGRISFYDLDLKILYWCQHKLLDSIRSISFDLSSTLLAPGSAVGEFKLESDEEEDFENEEEMAEYSEIKLGDNINERKMKYIEKIESMKYRDQVPSTMSVYLEETLKNYNKNQQAFTKLPHAPTDVTVEGAPFYIENFIIGKKLILNGIHMQKFCNIFRKGCLSGTVALIEIPTLKCRFIFQDQNFAITSLDAHPRSNFIVTGNLQGFVSLYDYERHKRVVRRKTPPLPDFSILLDKQAKKGAITYVTCPQSHEKLIAVTALKYSPIGNLLACGLENGALWMLHPLTLEPLDKNPYKHSTESILKLAFTECEEYMAYADNALVVAVFKRIGDSPNGSCLWDFIGKYHSHTAKIRDILFGPATIESVVYRFFSVGEDRNLIEYDLKNSGPYPFPGLQIMNTYQIECEAIPLCLAWYPKLGVEGFLMYSNSEYKYRLLNDITKTIRGTFLGPLCDTPVKHFKVISGKEYKAGKYMVFATNKEIGLQILPFDGNPYKTLGMIGHPRKVSNICLSNDGNILFTFGHNDPCTLMWKIKCRSVDVLAHLGGKGLAPYYSLIDGGEKGWLINEMKHLFYYAQILHQGENVITPRLISDKVSTKEIPNLMRAVGYYPSNEEIEILMGEISYRDYAETGHLVEEIKFEDFVKFYINHRPAFGISLHQIQEAFQVFANSDQMPASQAENPSLTREQFMRILLGEGPPEFSIQNGIPFGEPLKIQEAFAYMRFLVGFNENLDEIYNERNEKKSASIDFTFLPEVYLTIKISLNFSYIMIHVTYIPTHKAFVMKEITSHDTLYWSLFALAESNVLLFIIQRISYKDFIADIMGIELPEETRADDD